MWPAVWFSFGLTLVMLWFNDQVEPRPNHQLATLQLAILQTKPTFALRPQVINTIREGQFYLRAGKCLPVTCTEIIGRFRKPPTIIPAPALAENHLRLRISPDVTIAMGIALVDLTILSVPAGGSGRDLVWTVPNQYTGGDTDPVPLRDGGLVYTKYSIDDQSAVHSRVWLTTRPGAPGTPLTKPEEDCAQPALSPDGTSIAMVCRHGQLQSTELVLATFDAVNGTIGPEAVLIQGQLSASPTFSPDGQTIAFLAPVQQGGTFQLWTVPADTSPSPSAARPITQNVGLDSTAAPVWDKR